MKRHESRNISRRRHAIEHLNPCALYSSSAGINPFAKLLESLRMQKHLSMQVSGLTEKQIDHQVKMQADQKSAKARQNRKRNKV